MSGSHRLELRVTLDDGVTQLESLDLACGFTTYGALLALDVVRGDSVERK